MALKTAGTAATTTLSALFFYDGGTGNSAADFAALNALILNDIVGGQSVYGSFAKNGELFVPNRGVLKMLPGDLVAVDSTGWPILISSVAAASVSWVHS